MKRSIALAALFFLFSSANAHENTLAPNGKIVLNMPSMGDRNAFSFMGEFGGRTIRGSATYGSYINPCDRINFTGEILFQDLKYQFIGELKEKWMSQYAVGAKYQHLFLYDFLESVELAASFAHAFSRSVKDLPVSPGRVSSSDTVFTAAGTTLNLWDCGYFSPTINWDYVKYYRHYLDKKVAVGFGASLEFIQYLPLDFSIDLEADFRRPFYYYSGVLNWHHDFSSCGFDIGGYVNYTNGKETLPNVLVAGIQLGLSFGPSPSGCCNRKGEIRDSFTDSCLATEFCDLSSWVARPAIYMPVVLALPDQAP